MINKNKCRQYHEKLTFYFLLGFQGAPTTMVILRPEKLTSMHAQFGCCGITLSQLRFIPPPEKRNCLRLLALEPKVKIRTNQTLNVLFLVRRKSNCSFGNRYPICQPTKYLDQGLLVAFRSFACSLEHFASLKLRLCFRLMRCTCMTVYAPDVGKKLVQ